MTIYSPNKDYTGVSASVPFCAGVGETDDPRLIQWFKDHGYKVEEPDEADFAEPEAESPAEPKKVAKSKKGGEQDVL